MFLLLYGRHVGAPRKGLVVIFIFDANHQYAFLSPELIEKVSFLGSKVRQFRAVNE